MKRLILMGPIGCGKSTMIQTALGHDITRAGGFLTVRKLDGTQLLGFDLTAPTIPQNGHRFLDFENGAVRNDRVFSDFGIKCLQTPASFAVCDEFGGMELLNKTMEENFGLHIDGNVEVDFAGFTNLIDMLGGVDISLTSAEVKYMNHATDWNLTTGVNRLTGEQALVYSRIRAIDSDYRRAERQRKVILSLLERYKNQSLPEMLDMLSDVLPMVTTNMDKSEIVNYAVELAPMLTSMEMDTLRIPVDGSFRQGNVKVREGLANWFQYDIDFQRNRQVLRELLEE